LSTKTIDTLLLEERRYPPPAEFAAQANAQPDIYDRDPDEFWDTEARERVTWFEPFTELKQWEPCAKWFVGGKLNVTLQLRRPPRRSRQRRQGGLLLGRRAR
jgi:acetyl-CoA synthetase